MAASARRMTAARDVSLARLGLAEQLVNGSAFFVGGNGVSEMEIQC